MFIRNQTIVVRLGILGLGVSLLSVTGCGMSGDNHPVMVAPVEPHAVPVQGRVYGGQQPVVGASIQLYAPGTSGYGSQSTPLLTTPVSTDSGGGFTISKDYTCPSPTTPVYLVATGGNPGLGSINPQIAVMTVLGACGNLTSSTFINLNELTTVAAVWALAPFMQGYAMIGTSSSNSIGMANAFATASELVNTTTGTAPGKVVAGTIVPVAELNTLANTLASCVNSGGGSAGDASPCGNLFASATPTGGTTPTDTVGAALNIATNPAQNVSAILSLTAAQAPFQPTIASATDLTVAIKYTPAGINTPSSSALDANGNLWVANQTGSVAQLAQNGALLATYTNAINSPSAIAVDANGNVWVANQTNSTLTVISGGTSTDTGLTGLNKPSGVSIDNQGILWIANSGSNSLTAVTTLGATLTGAATYTGAGLNNPVSVAINPH